MAILNDFITLKEAAQISGYHSDYIGALIRSKKIRGKKDGRVWKVSKKDVQNHLVENHYVDARIFFKINSKGVFLVAVIIVLVLVGYGALLAWDGQPTLSADSTEGTVIVEKKAIDNKNSTAELKTVTVTQP